MFQWLAITFFLFSCCVLQAQTQENTILQDSIYTFAEIMPQPESGYAKFYKYLQENLYYTQEALDKKIEGYVFVSFIVDKRGQIHNIKIIKGLGYGLDEEVIRVFSESPPWRAGYHNKEPVNVKMTFQVVFRLPR